MREKGDKTQSDKKNDDNSEKSCIATGWIDDSTKPYTDDEIELFPSNRGTNKLSLRHFCYQRSSSSSKKVYFICDKHICRFIL